jgi:membrane-associated protease RseP (regulator of RpoE activity)
VKVKVEPGKVQVEPGGVKVEPGRVRVGAGDVTVEPGKVRVGAGGVRVGPGGVEVAPGGVHVHVGPLKLSEYWLGVECYPAAGPLRTQLGLPADQGLVVERVLSDGPAAEAGLQQHDVLVTAGGQPLKTVADLARAVDQAQAKELALEVIRGGQKQTITVTPAKRPATARPLYPFAVPEGPEWDRVERWFKHLWPEEGAEGRAPMRFRFWRPGMILPPGAPVHPPLPKNVQVTITRHGEEPATIVVERGDEKWEVTEEELDKLPADVRPHVERMLGRVPHESLGDVQVFEFGPEWPQPPKLEPDRLVPEPPEGPLEKRLERRIEEMNRRIEQLRKSIEELREKRSRRQPLGQNPDHV